MKSRFAVLRSKGVALVSVFAASVVAVAPAHADIEAAITAAQSAGVSQVTLAIGAVVAICALVMGLNIIIGLLRK